MFKLGLTGGIASGKSAVARLLVELGAQLVDSDVLARQAVEPGSPALAALREAFGPQVFTADGELDRRRLREMVFHDAGARRRLNAIVHPEVARGVARELARLEGQDGVVVVDVPLLFETGWQALFDATLVVFVPPEVQVARLMARDKVSETQARAALSAQMPLAEKRALAQFVVDNTGTLEETRRQLQSVWLQITKQTEKVSRRTQSDPQS